MLDCQFQIQHIVVPEEERLEEQLGSKTKFWFAVDRTVPNRLWKRARLNTYEDISEKLTAEDPGNTRLTQNLSALHFQYGELYADMREWDKAARSIREAVAMSRGILKGDPRDTVSARLVLECLVLLPPVLAAGGKQQEAKVMAAELARYAQAGMFTKSKEPRIRAAVAKAFVVAAEQLPAEEKELVARAEAEWAEMEKEGLREGGGREE